MVGFYHTYDSVARELVRGLRSGDILLSGADQTNPNDHKLNRDPETGRRIGVFDQKNIKKVYNNLFWLNTSMSALLIGITIIAIYANPEPATLLMAVLLVGLLAGSWFCYISMIKISERSERTIEQLHATSRTLVENGLIVLPESTSTLGVAKRRVERDGIASYEPFLLHLDLHPNLGPAATVWIKVGEEREFDDLDQAVAYAMDQLEHA